MHFIECRQFSSQLYNKFVQKLIIAQEKEQMQKSNQKKNKQEHSEQEFQQVQLQNNDTMQFAISQVFNTINQAYSSSIRVISQVATNIAYNAKHSSCPFLHRKQIKLKPNGEPAYLLGKKFLPADKEAFQEAFHSIIWICYRSQLEDKFGDVGWGCMIRVCQMVLAQALKKCHPNKHNSEIIKEFSTSNSALFSFDKICMQGKIMKRWTSTAQIMIAIQGLLKQQQAFKLKIEMYNMQVSIDDVESENNYPILLVVSNRLGTKNIQTKMGDHIRSILQSKFSIGLISAIGGQAIYIAGYHQDQFIALDPHYVQSQAQGQKKYFNQVPRGVTLQKLVPTLGFCFYFKTGAEHKQWIYDLAESYHYHRPNIAIQCDQQFCRKVYEEKHPKKDNYSSDQFEVLQ